MALRKSKPPANRRLKVYITSAVMGAIASGAAIVVFALLVFILRLPVAHSGFLSLLAFGIGCLTAGGFAGALKRQGGLGSGIKAALLFTLPIILIGYVLGSFTAPAPAQTAEAVAPVVRPAMAGVASAFNKIVIAVLCGGIGGVFGVNKNGGF
jgi:hypothetical protein